MTRPPLRAHQSVVIVAAAIALLVAASCSTGGDGPAPASGGASPRAVVDAHIAAYRAYDLAAACNLLSPARRAEMARLDGAEAEGYCVGATEQIVASATPATKARNRAIYTKPKVTELSRPGGTWFRIEAADGSYGENIEVAEIDGRWWVAQVESDLDSAGD